MRHFFILNANYEKIFFTSCNLKNDVSGVWNGSLFVDYDVELSENGFLFDFVINGRKSAIYPNKDGILYIDGISYKKNEL